MTRSLTVVTLATTTPGKVLEVDLMYLSGGRGYVVNVQPMTKSQEIGVGDQLLTTSTFDCFTNLFAPVDSAATRFNAKTLAKLAKAPVTKMVCQGLVRKICERDKLALTPAALEWFFDYSKPQYAGETNNG